MKLQKESLSEPMIDTVAQWFKLLSEPARLRLIRALMEGEKTVGALTVELDGNQPNVSRHLTALHEGGLLTRRKDGNSTYYSIADPVVFDLCDLACSSSKRFMQKKIAAFMR